MRQQYLEFRRRFTGNVIFFQVRAFCDLYHAGDKSTADLLGLSTIGENRRGARYGFPMNKGKQYLQQLLEKRIPAMMVLERRRSLMLTHLCSYRLTHGMRNSFVCDEEEGIAG